MVPISFVSGVYVGGLGISTELVVLSRFLFSFITTSWSKSDVISAILALALASCKVSRIV